MSSFSKCGHCIGLKNRLTQFDPERLHQPIYGAGLPRTGTTSLAAALEILGYKVAHYCPITNPSTKAELDNEYDAYVSSELLLNANFNNGLWILLHRNEWLNSMYSLGEDLCEWQNHIKVWESVENLHQDNILHFNIKDGWEPLCNFLEVEVPNIKFPRLNHL